MFGKMMNNYYYGKSGKGDFKKDDLPSNRWELFRDTLKTRLNGLFRLNLMYMIIWLPAMIVLFTFGANALQIADVYVNASEHEGVAVIETQVTNADGTEETVTNNIEIKDPFQDVLSSLVMNMLLWLIPCIAITGPATAGISYVTRNWARDEHAFIWSDFKDAVKANWKQSLVVSVITSLLPMIVFMCWTFYGQMAQQQTFMLIPQVLSLMIGILWALAVTYMYPLIVQYELKTKDLFRNAFLLAVARLPMSVGIRLLHCLPAVIGFLLALFWNPVYAMLFVLGWYFLIGFALSRFVTASYTNGVFDKYINSHIEGAVVNRGLRNDDDDDGDEEVSEQEDGTVE